MVRNPERAVLVPSSVLWAVALFLWAALSLLWSDDPKGGATELANGFGLLVLFCTVALAPRDFLKSVTAPVAVWVVGGAVVLGLIFPQYHAGFGNENFQSEFLLIGTPLLFASSGLWGLRRNDHWVVPMLIAGLAVWSLAFNQSDTKWVAFVAAYLWVCGMIWKRSMFAATVLVLAAANIGFWLLDGGMAQSVFHRVELAINTTAMWLASPVWGHGIGSFNIQYPNFQEVHLAILPGSLFGDEITKFVGAAHNEYLQILSDYGLIGGLLLFCLLSTVIGKKRDALDQACFVSLLMAGLLSLIEFPAQNPHTGALIAVAAGCMANGRYQREFVWSWPKRVSVGIAGLALAGLALTSSIKTAQSWESFRHTFAFMERKDYMNALAANFAAYNAYPWLRHPRHQLPLSLEVLLSHMPDNTRIDPKTADLIFDIGSKAAGRTTVIEAARVEYLINSGRLDERAEEAAERVQWLKENASSHNVTWLLSARYELETGQYAQAIQTAQRALSLKSISAAYYKQARAVLVAAIQGATG